MKYEKTKYPNILTYEVKSGTRYRIRKKLRMPGEEDVVDESGFKTLAHACKSALKRTRRGYRQIRDGVHSVTKTDC